MHPGASKLCLNGGRFEVKVTWTDFDGHTGPGTTVPQTADTGAFYYFSPANLELMLKVLDGRQINGHFWVFYGSLSDVGFDITVTDTLTGVVQTYHNPAQEASPAAATSKPSEPECPTEERPAPARVAGLFLGADLGRTSES